MRRTFQRNYGRRSTKVVYVEIKPRRRKKRRSRSNNSILSPVTNILNKITK